MAVSRSLTAEQRLREWADNPNDRTLALQPSELRTLVAALLARTDELNRERDALRDVLVDRWHETCPNEERSLHEWMGMTWDEYADWVSPGSALAGSSPAAEAEQELEEGRPVVPRQPQPRNAESQSGLTDPSGSPTPSSGRDLHGDVDRLAGAGWHIRLMPGVVEHWNGPARTIEIRPESVEEGEA